MRLLLIVALIFVLSCSGSAQWQMQDSHTNADLRGIHSIGKGVAWASGTGGTVLRTTDDGAYWQPCVTPPGAEALDFRGIQAFDADTAIVMSSGKGDLSRLYKTTDACKTWKLVFTNPDKDGFWDAIRFGGAEGILVGDPIDGKFSVFRTKNEGLTWTRWGITTKDDWDKESPAKSMKDETLFAASNEAVWGFGDSAFLYVTGGASRARLIYADEGRWCTELGVGCRIKFSSVSLPLIAGSKSAGAFAVASRVNTFWPLKLMVVGGDYEHPDNASRNAVFLSSRDGAHFPFTSYFDVIQPAAPPHGFRSAVAYDSATKTWITVGLNGTDISTDDGLNWRALKPSPTDAPDADKNWNALSLPFVVGPKGRVGRLRTEVLKP